MGAECGLHPLIHTLLESSLVQDIDYFQLGEKRNPIDQSSKGLKGSIGRDR